MKKVDLFKAPDHLLGTGQTLRTVADYKGDELVEKVLEIVRRYKPIHISIVGGEPLVRYRELSVLLPNLSKMGIAVQVVTSAVREIPSEWNDIDELYCQFRSTGCSRSTTSVGSRLHMNASFGTLRAIA